MSDLTSYQKLGPVEVLCEFECVEAEAEEGPESRAAGPGTSAGVILTRVFIWSRSGLGGEWADAEMFDADWVTETEAAILLEIKE